MILIFLEAKQEIRENALDVVKSAMTDALKDPLSRGHVHV